MLYPSAEEYKDSKFLGQTYSLPIMLHIVLWQTNFFLRPFYTEGEVRLKKIRKSRKGETHCFCHSAGDTDNRVRPRSAHGCTQGLHWFQEDYSCVHECVTDRRDLVLVALTFPGCSIYLCILGNRLVQSDVLYLGSPSPTQNRNNFRLKASPMPEDEKAKSFRRQRTYQNHQGFTWVGLNKELHHSLWQFGWRDNESILYFQTKIIVWMGEHSCLSYLESGNERIGIAEIIPEFGLWCKKLIQVLQSEMGYILSSLSHYHLL